jgi:hypothetical protein
MSSTMPLGGRRSGGSGISRSPSERPAALLKGMPASLGAATARCPNAAPVPDAHLLLAVGRAAPQSQWARPEHGSTRRGFDSGEAVSALHRLRVPWWYRCAYEIFAIWRRSCLEEPRLSVLSNSSERARLHEHKNLKCSLPAAQLCLRNERINQDKGRKDRPREGTAIAQRPIDPRPHAGHSGR